MGTTAWNNKGKKTKTILHHKTNKSEKSRAASPLRPQFGLTSIFEILRRHQHTQLHEVQKFLGHGQPWELLLIYDTLRWMNTKEKTIELHVSTTGTSTTWNVLGSGSDSNTCFPSLKYKNFANLAGHRILLSCTFHFQGPTICLPPMREPSMRRMSLRNFRNEDMFQDPEKPRLAKTGYGLAMSGPGKNWVSCFKAQNMWFFHFGPHAAPICMFELPNLGQCSTPNLGFKSVVLISLSYLPKIRTKFNSSLTWHKVFFLPVACRTKFEMFSWTNQYSSDVAVRSL